MQNLIRPHFAADGQRANAQQAVRRRENRLRRYVVRGESEARGSEKMACYGFQGFFHGDFHFQLFPIYFQFFNAPLR